MNPWLNCRRRYEPHFFERMIERSLPQEQVNIALSEGEKIPDGQKNIQGQNYEIRWRRWILKVTLMQCVIVLHTAYLD
jgi:hypothetical protein